MAIGASKNNEPIRSGLVAMIGPLIDTIIVCTITGIVILLSGDWMSGEFSGVTLTQKSFANHKKIKANHFAVTVNNLEIFMEYLKSNDIYFESWDGNELQYNIRPHDNALQIYLTDPEGNWIEVNQRQ